MIRFICAQPAIDYYLWQVEVMINNFKKFGVNPNQIDILLGITNGVIPDKWKILQNHYNTVRFFFYEDTRSDKSYIPSIYFNLLKQHISRYPELENENLLLHDSDIVLTKEIPNDWLDMCNGNSWYLSDTNSYINYDYIKSKGGTTYDDMCKIIGLDPLIPKLLNSNSGGAQYLTKKTTPQFWEKVENNSIELYSYFTSVEHLYQKKHDGDYPIQKWTAGMWSLLWNSWLFGFETIVDKRLGFCWSTDNINLLDKFVILHNAGVTDNVNMFYKGSYMNTLPYNEDLNINPKKCSHFYWEQVKETSLISPLTNKSN